MERNYGSTPKSLKHSRRSFSVRCRKTANLARNSERQAKAAELLAQITKTEQEREKLRELTEAQPDFVAAGGGTSPRRKTYTDIRNRGGPVRDIELSYVGPHSIEFKPPRRFETNAQATLHVEETQAPLAYPIVFDLSYTDRLDNRWTKTFELRDNHELREVSCDAEGRSDSSGST